MGELVQTGEDLLDLGIGEVGSFRTEEVPGLGGSEGHGGRTWCSSILSLRGGGVEESVRDSVRGAAGL